MNELQIECAKASIKKMMDNGWFDICVIDTILKINGAIPLKEDYDALRLLHCVHFKDMSQRIRIELPGLMQRVLESPSMDLEIRFKPMKRIASLIEC